jgi:putative spermidine/putrescine transport system permease protein
VNSAARAPSLETAARGRSARPLPQLVRRAERRRTLVAWGLIAPALALVLVWFVAPIGVFLLRSVANPEVPETLPRTLAQLRGWDGRGLPGEAAYAALIADLRAVGDPTTLAILGRRLNYNIAGFRTLVLRTASRLPPGEAPAPREALIALDPRWGEAEYWTTIKSEGGWVTPFFLLAALDLRYGPDGTVVRAPPDQALYNDLFLRTVWISLCVTALCLVIGFPVAYVMAVAPPRTANWLLILVLLPFWTSLLVRTTAWVILLQTEGLLNQFLLALGVLSAPAKLIFNRVGLYIAMTHVLLPFLILPLYSVMKGIAPEHMRAAASLGARPATAFRLVYLPQVRPGILAGCSLVFVIALGFYITPALVGGPGDQMVGYFIAYFTNQSVNWGMGSALALLLVAIAALLFVVAGRVVGVDALRVR